MDARKKAAFAAIDKSASSLYSLSQDLWNNPEVRFEEFHAHTVLTHFLEDHNFKVERGYKLETAFRAVIGDDKSGPHVAVLCEYDALPGIGHGCGHNLIAEVGVAVGLGIKAAFDVTEEPIGKLSVIGTPAEEGGGGKILLIDEGVFKDIDVAMMAHPGPGNDNQTNYLCSSRLIIKYHGKASHAAASPWEGVNALDAAVTCYQSISNMRQQMKPTWRVHGIFTNGGQRPNIIPEMAEMEYYLRTPTKHELGVLKYRIIECVTGAGKTSGCKVTYEFSSIEYLNVMNNKSLYDCYRQSATLLTNGTSMENTPLGSPISISTDMGNLSHIVPSIHPLFYIGTDAINHTREFTDASGDQKAQPYVLVQAKALAEAAIKVYSKPDFLESIKCDFQKDIAAG